MSRIRAGPMPRAKRPIYFSVPMATWRGGARRTLPAQMRFRRMEGYDKYPKRGFERRQVLLRDMTRTTLLQQLDRRRNSLLGAGDTPADFKFGGVSLKTYHAVNDVEKFTVDGKPWYLMALHQEGRCRTGRQRFMEALIQPLKRWHTF